MSMLSATLRSLNYIRQKNAENALKTPYIEGFKYPDMKAMKHPYEGCAQDVMAGDQDYCSVGLRQDVCPKLSNETKAVAEMG